MAKPWLSAARNCQAVSSISLQSTGSLPSIQTNSWIMMKIFTKAIVCSVNDFRERETDRQTDRQRGRGEREKERERDRQTETETDRQTETERPLLSL